MAAIQFATPDRLDNDGFYRIKPAYVMQTKGLKPDFPWVPLSILNEREYYDHHFLFHVFLIPFTFGNQRVRAMGISDAFLYRMSVTRVQSLSLAVLALSYAVLLQGKYKPLLVKKFFMTTKPLFLNLLSLKRWCSYALLDCRDDILSAHIKRTFLHSCVRGVPRTI